MGFTESTLHNRDAPERMLQHLIELRTGRSLGYVMPGTRGLYTALQQHFGASLKVQRCQWVLRYLPEDDRMATRHALLRAWQAPDYDEAKRAWIQLHGAVKKANLTAGRCLKVGLEETLTLQRACVYAPLGRSLKATHCIGHASLRLARRLRARAPWMAPEERNAHMTLGLLEMETRMHRMAHAAYLLRLREGLFEAPSNP